MVFVGQDAASLADDRDTDRDWLDIVADLRGGVPRIAERVSQRLPGRVNFMRSHIDGNTRVVFAPQEYGFQLGFGPLLVTDMRLGFHSGRVAEMIVTSEAYDGDLGYLEHFEKPLADHIRRTMGRYCLACNTKSAQVFLPRGEDQPACIK
jgi:hypothetical protein